MSVAQLSLGAATAGVYASTEPRPASWPSPTMWPVRPGRAERRGSAGSRSRGHTLRFDPAHRLTLELRGYLVVHGTLEMKPNQGVRAHPPFRGYRW